MVLPSAVSLGCLLLIFLDSIKLASLVFTADVITIVFRLFWSPSMHKCITLLVLRFLWRQIHQGPNVMITIVRGCSYLRNFWPKICRFGRNNKTKLGSEKWQHFRHQKGQIHNIDPSASSNGAFLKRQIIKNGKYFFQYCCLRLIEFFWQKQSLNRRSWVRIPPGCKDSSAVLCNLICIVMECIWVK
jgi:hypothetical protein